MNIAVIGTGRIGTALATAWKNAGHSVCFGSRSRADGKNGIDVAAVEDAVGRSEVVVLAIPGSALPDTVGGLDLERKLVIDCTNGGNTAERTTVEMIADAAPSATVVKAFSTLGVENFRDPKFGAEHADLLYVSSDDSQSGAIRTLITDVGLNPVHVGDLGAVDVLDAATRFWFMLARVYGRHTAYKVLKQE